MKKTVLFAVCLSLFVIGCAAPQKVQEKAFLSKGLPERFFTDASIDIDESKDVSYVFESKMDDPFLYYEAHIDLNPSFESVLRYYMNSKYSITGSSGGDYHVDVILLSCKYEAVEAGRETIHGAGVSSAGTTAATVSAVFNMKVTTEMTVKVRVDIGGKVREREIMAMGEFTGNMTDASTVTRSFDLAIRGVISRLDRFLNSTIGTATAPAADDGDA